MADEPIQARRPSRATRWRNWIYRNPWTISGVVALVLLLVLGVSYGLLQQIFWLEWKLAGSSPLGRKPLDYFFPSGFTLFLVLEFFLLQTLPLASFLKARRSGWVKGRSFVIYFGLGLTQIDFGFVVLFRGIAAFIWVDNRLADFLLFNLPAALSNVWFGSWLIGLLLRDRSLSKRSGRHLQQPEDRPLPHLSSTFLLLTVIAEALCLAAWVGRGIEGNSSSYILAVIAAFGLTLFVAILAAMCRVGLARRTVYLPGALLALSFMLVSVAGLATNELLLAWSLGAIGGLLQLKLKPAQKVDSHGRLQRVTGLAGRLYLPSSRSPRQLGWMAASIVGAALGLLLIHHFLGTYRLQQALDRLHEIGAVIPIESLAPHVPQGETIGSREFAEITGSLRQQPIKGGYVRSYIESAPGYALSGWSPDRASPHYDKKSTWPEFHRQMAEIAPAMEKLRIQAAKTAPRSRIDYDLELPEYDFVGMREAAQWLGADIIHHLRQQERGLALSNLVALAQIAQFGRDEPNLLAQMIRIAISGLGCSLGWELLQDPKLTDGELRQIQNAWSRVDLFQSYLQAFQMELTRNTTKASRLKSHSHRDLERLLHPRQVSSGLPKPLEPRWPMGFVHRQVLFPAWKFSALDAMVATEVLRQQLEIESIRTGIESRSLAAFRAGRGPAQAAVNSRTMSEIFYSGCQETVEYLPLNPGFAASFHTVMLNQTFKDQLLGAIAIRRYQLQHAAFPSSLEALVPDFASSIPWDYLAGKPQLYKPLENSEFALYSIGENNQDEGGLGDDKPWPRLGVPLRFEARTEETNAGVMTIDSAFFEVAIRQLAREANFALQIDSKASRQLHEPSPQPQPATGFKQGAEGLLRSVGVGGEKMSASWTVIRPLETAPPGPPKVLPAMRFKGVGRLGILHRLLNNHGLALVRGPTNQPAVILHGGDKWKPTMLDPSEPAPKQENLETTIHFSADMPLEDAILLLGRMAHKNLVLNPAVIPRGRRLNSAFVFLGADATPERALAFLLAHHNLMLVADSLSPVFRVTKKQ